MDWVILAVVALLLFGGTRLAGIGKGAGRAIREFKEETQTVKKGDKAPEAVEGAPPAETTPPPSSAAPPVVEAEVVEPSTDKPTTT